MLSYVFKRILLMIPTLIGITLVTFFVMKLAPGDPVMLKLRFAGENLDPNALAAVLKSKAPPIELPESYLSFAKSVGAISSGLDVNNEQIEKTRSFSALKWIGENTLYYFKWLGSMARLDFGLSMKDRRPVTLKIREA